MSDPAIDATALLTAILVMAVVTYLTRVGGVWLASLIPETRKFERFLHHLSGSVLAALAVTMAFSGDAARAAGVAGGCIVMLITRNAFVSMLAATVLSALVRAGGM